MPKCSSERKISCNALLRTARKHYADQPYSPPSDWLNGYVNRIVSCFAGHGLPEEISVICSLSAVSGHKSAGQIQDRAAQNFGLDCNGFVNACFTSLGVFRAPLCYIPSYKNRAGAAKTVADVSCDNAVIERRRRRCRRDNPAGGAPTSPPVRPGAGSAIRCVEGL